MPRLNSRGLHSRFGNAVPEFSSDVFASCFQDKILQFFNREPLFHGVDHAVAVGAEQGQVAQLRLMTEFEGMQGFRIVTFDDALASFSVMLLETKPADLTKKSPVLREKLFFLLLNQLLVSLPAPVHVCKNPALLGLHLAILQAVIFKQVICRLGDNDFPDGLGHLPALIRMAGKLIPDDLVVFASPLETHLPPALELGVEVTEAHQLHMDAIGVAVGGVF